MRSAGGDNQLKNVEEQTVCIYAFYFDISNLSTSIRNGTNVMNLFVLYQGTRLQQVPNFGDPPITFGTSGTEWYPPP